MWPARTRILVSSGAAAALALAGYAGYVIGDHGESAPAALARQPVAARAKSPRPAPSPAAPRPAPSPTEPSAEATTGSPAADDGNPCDGPDASQFSVCTPNGGTDGVVPASPPASVIANRMAAAGMPVTQLTVYNASTDPNSLLGRPGGYTSKVAWVDPRTLAKEGSPSSDPGGVEFGGGIEVFPDQDDAHDRLALLQSFKPPIGDGYDVLSGTAILRLSADLTPAQEQAMAAAFNQALGS